MFNRHENDGAREIFRYHNIRFSAKALDLLDEPDAFKLSMRERSPKGLKNLQFRCVKKMD